MTRRQAAALPRSCPWITPPPPLRLHPLYMRAEAVELLVDQLIAAVDVVDSVDLRGPLGLQAREDERGGSAEVARHDRRAAHARDAFDDRRRAFELDLRAHPLELGDVHEALRKDGLGNGAQPFRPAEHGTELRLHIGRKSGVRL